ncbi:MAG: hypothetical protein ACLVJH_04555 [Faecalibacterium prausnitzii]
MQFLDGGYRDNMPTALAQKMGAEELVCVDLEGVGITRPNRTGLPTTMIRSYWELGISSTLNPTPPDGTSSWATTIPAAPWDICGAAPMLCPPRPRAARMLPRSVRNSSRCRRPCGKSTPSP